MKADDAGMDRKPFPYGKAILAFVLLYIGIAVIVYFQPEPPPQKESKVGAEAQRESETNVIFSPKRMPVLKYQWGKGGFDTVYMLYSIKIKNKNSFPVIHITVGCDQIAPDGTVLGTLVKPLYQRLEAGETKTFRGINMGRLFDQSAERSACMVIRADSAYQIDGRAIFPEKPSPQEARLLHSITSHFSTARTDAGKLLLGFTLRNDNAIAVENFRISCRNYNSDGTELSPVVGVVHAKLNSKASGAFNNVPLGVASAAAHRYACALIGVQRSR